MQVASVCTTTNNLRSEIDGWTYEDSSLLVRKKAPGLEHVSWAPLFIGYTPSPKLIPHYYCILEMLSEGWRLLGPPARTDWTNVNGMLIRLTPNEPGASMYLMANKMTAKQLEQAARKASKLVTCKRCQGRGTFMTDRVCYGCGGIGTYLVHAGDSRRLAKLAHIAQVQEMLDQELALEAAATRPQRRARYAAAAAKYRAQIATLTAELETL